MNIEPTEIIEEGPGVGVSLRDGRLSCRLSDPHKDLHYAKNAVTLVYDLSALQNTRLAFAAREFGDEPHAPPSNPFTGDANFDGVAIGDDGVTWYEIQDLRHLKSNAFTDYDLDLDAAIAAAGLTHSSGLRVRIVQYDNNPAPMDGVFLNDILLTGDTWTPPTDPSLLLRLTMDDNAPSPLVRDETRRHHQTFVDASGDADTAAHSVEGSVGRALSFDGVDDRIALTPDSHRPALAEDQDFTIAFWWRCDSPATANTRHMLSNYTLTDSSFYHYHSSDGSAKTAVRFVEDGGAVRTIWANYGAMTVGQWVHYSIVREGADMRFYHNAVLAHSDSDPGNTASLAPLGVDLAVGAPLGGFATDQGAMDDLRIDKRALTQAEIEGLC